RRHTRWPRDWSSDVCSSDLSVTSRLARRAATCKSQAAWYSVRIHACGIKERKVIVFFPRRRKVIPTNAEIRGEFCGHLPRVVDRSEERRVGKEGRCEEVRDE